MGKQRVVVTGGSGNLGSMAIEELIACGYEALNLDVVAPRKKLCESWIADLSRSGDLYEAFKGADSVIHLAAYQAPDMASDTAVFANNITASYNVLKAATDMGVRRVVMASSIAAYGFLYAPAMWSPGTLPLDEDYPCTPQDPYALSKVFAEQLADSFASPGATSVISLRFSGVNLDLSYASLPERWADPGARIGTFWSYVDVRDAALACRLAIEAELSGHRILNIAAPTSRYLQPTSDLVRDHLPGTRIKRGMTGNWSGLDSTRAKDVLGFEASHLWRDYIRPDGTPIPQQ